MTIHKEGFKIIIIVIICLIVLNSAILWLTSLSLSIIAGIILLSLLFLVFILRFFRKPSRKTDHSEGFVYAAADGTIVAIEEVFEPEYFKDKRLLISIFMSVWNVHINWYPITGIIKYSKYHQGKYLLARHPKSSELNERTSIVIADNKGREILFRQIAGTVARRIVCYAIEGLKVKSGEETGFIKFGSRVDIFLPPGTQIKVTRGQKVTGGKTPLASLV